MQPVYKLRDSEALDKSQPVQVLRGRHCNDEEIALREQPSDLRALQRLINHIEVVLPKNPRCRNEELLGPTSDRRRHTAPSSTVMARRNLMGVACGPSIRSAEWPAP